MSRLSHVDSQTWPSQYSMEDQVTLPMPDNGNNDTTALTEVEEPHITYGRWSEFFVLLLIGVAIDTFVFMIGHVVVAIVEFDYRLFVDGYLTLGGLTILVSAWLSLVPPRARWCAPLSIMVYMCVALLVILAAHGD